ncbi:MAG: hypothetical protein ACKOZV_14895 [Bacteroidota bacterium]
MNKQTMHSLDDFERNKQPLVSGRLTSQWKAISFLTIFLSVFGLIQTTILLVSGLYSSELTGALGFAYGKNRFLSALSENSFILTALIVLDLLRCCTFSTPNCASRCLFKIASVTTTRKPSRMPGKTSVTVSGFSAFISFQRLRCT